MRSSAIAGALALVAGCGGGMYAGFETSAPMEAPGADEPPALETLGEVAAGPGMTATSPAGHSAQASLATVVDPTASSGGETPVEQEGRAPLLIYQAQLDVQVDGGEIAGTIDRAIDHAVRLGGYLAARDDRSVTVRIPSRRFTEGLRTLEQLGDVTHRQVSAQDVSEEFHDLEVRVDNLVALRERMQTLLARADTIEEMLRVEQELARITREIDQARGRLRFLGSRAAYSTVTLALAPRPVVEVEVEVEVHEPPPPPPPRAIDLPIGWLDRVGLDPLLTLN